MFRLLYILQLRGDIINQTTGDQEISVKYHYDDLVNYINLLIKFKKKEKIIVICYNHLFYKNNLYSYNSSCIVYITRGGSTGDGRKFPTPKKIMRGFYIIL